MTRLDRHLLVALGLIGLAALTPAPPDRTQVTSGPLLDSIPTTLGSWTAETSSVETVLPVDSRSRESIGRVYDSGQRRLWLSVARYTSTNGPATRPALQALVRERGTSSLVRARATLSVDGAEPISVMRVSLRFSDRVVTVWYWYQVGRRIVGDEYSLRFWLTLNTLLRRDHSLLLIRVATVDTDFPGNFLKFLVPCFYKLAAPAERE